MSAMPRDPTPLHWGGRPRATVGWRTASPPSSRPPSRGPTADPPRRCPSWSAPDRGSGTSSRSPRRSAVSPRGAFCRPSCCARWDGWGRRRRGTALSLSGRRTSWRIGRWRGSGWRRCIELCHPERTLGMTANLPIDRLHARFVVPLPRRHTLGRHVIDLLQVGGGQLNLERVDVLLEVLAPLGPEERNDVVTLRQHPCQRELGWAAPLPFRDRLDLLDQLQVLPEVVALEPG